MTAGLGKHTNSAVLDRIEAALGQAESDCPCAVDALPVARRLPDYFRAPLDLEPDPPPRAPVLRPCVGEARLLAFFGALRGRVTTKSSVDCTQCSSKRAVR